MLRTMLLLIVSALMLAPASAQNTTYDPVFESDECLFPLPDGEVEGSTIFCGYLILPETRDSPESEMVALAVAILHSTGTDPAPDPLVYLSGGPGSSALLEAADWAASPLRQDRDIILIDQRGTGYSLPTLDCYELYDDVDDPEGDCYARLRAEGIDLNAYNSAANAADIADLRRALALDEINLYGVSYGTRLALTVLRDHPEGIRSVVLDSAYPLHVNGLDEQTMHGVHAIQHLFEVCAADPACAEAYGDLESTLYRVVDELNENPFPTTDPTTEAEFDATGDDVVNILFEALYISASVPTLPYAIHLLGAGDYTYGLDMLYGGYTLADLQTLGAGEALEEAELLELPDDAPDGDSEGMFNSVECYDEVRFNTPETAESLAADLPPQLAGPLSAGVDEQFNTCSFWDSGRAPAIENEPVASDVPTLVLSGSFDPITPPAWGQAAADHLSRSHHVIFPNAGHSVLDSGECAVTVIQSFLSNPLAEPDTACVESSGVEFYVPGVCTVEPLDVVAVHAGPGEAFEEVGALGMDVIYTADAWSSDGEYSWLRLADAEGAWVREDVVDFPPDCFMLPFLEE